MARTTQNSTALGQVARSCIVWLVLAAAVGTQAQQVESVQAPAPVGTHPDPQQSSQQVLRELEAMRKRIDELEAQLKQANSVAASGTSGQSSQPQLQSRQSISATNSPERQQTISAADRDVLNSLGETTINVSLDTYYEYNFNHPVGALNLLRAYDVSSNQFSLNQAAVVIEYAPDPGQGRRWGGRFDLQFGQATASAQGNPANEPRPDIYRNVFQAYGSYVAPIGKGISLDFGKWASALGLEGNYTKDQMNYSRSLWFAFLPVYHMGLRSAIPVNDRFTINYWLVNGINQVEKGNGFKDQLFGFTAKPAKTITWTMNYYLGQENPDRAASSGCGPIPIQPGLCFTAIDPAPNGRTHIFDSYATWQPNPRVTLAVEGDYFIARPWRNAAPGESSAPAHVDGGAGYVQYQLSPRIALASRAEYMSDREGLFSGLPQALKENTVTFDYKLADNFLMRYEWRRDFSNRPTFLSDVQGLLRKSQNTAAVGMIWWWGRKQGAW